MSRFSQLLELPRPLVMGILNVTPDSFSDAGKFLNLTDACQHALTMVQAGVDIIDVGGESTRPGAPPVPVQEEQDRVLPVLEHIRQRFDVCFSVDTSTAGVMLSAADLGADLINDVRALRREGALTAAAQTGLPVCLMHMQGDPLTMQLEPRYEDLIAEINKFFSERIAVCVAAGISRQQLLLDPGFGFGKTPEHNLQLINRLEEFSVHGLPLLVGLSRKSTIAKITGDLATGSLAGALSALQRGAKIIRVHDVAETVSALRVTEAIRHECLEI